MSTVLGILGVIASFSSSISPKSTCGFPRRWCSSFIFLKLAIAGHLTIFVTRTEGRFWQKPYPSPILFWAAFLTKVAATLFAVYGWFIAPIGWRYALWIWVYCLVWFVVNDFAKYRSTRCCGETTAEENCRPPPGAMWGRLRAVGR